MKESTRRELWRMGQEVQRMVFQKMRRQLVKDTTDYSTINAIMEALERKNNSVTQRAMLLNMAKTMAPTRTSEIDREVEKAYDECWNYVMRKAKESGRIPPPDKEDIEFLERMHARMQGRKKEELK